ncbi:hypothetical protein TNCV_3446741 [Trichonephila clavipes]|nr:hypothetical protein TNCV_3446741 [Trichonephila clavipes]
MKKQNEMLAIVGNCLAAFIARALLELWEKLHLRFHSIILSRYFFYTPKNTVAAVAKWSRYRIMADLVTTKDLPCRGAMHVKSVESSNILPWCGMVVRRECQSRCCSRHLTMVQNYVVRCQKPSFC